MKSKIYLFGFVFSMLFSLNACKPKQSAYKKAYEAAKAREMQENTRSANDVTPVTKPATSNVYDFQKERVTAVDGSAIHLYNVVIGSFINQTNARSLKERMERQGYYPVLALNEKGMYRVIVASFDDRSKAVAEKAAIRERFSPEFSDAWLLEQE